MAEEYELVGVGKHQVGSVEGWCITYEKAPAEDEGDIPDFVHLLFPAVIFGNYAEQFGLDLDDPEDFTEILEIILYSGFAGGDDPSDYIDDEPQMRGLLGAQRANKKNKTGRSMERRARRGKDKVTITGMGVDGIRDRLWADRHRGIDDLRARIERLEKQHARRTPEVPDRPSQTHPALNNAHR